jgi:hypothetical protein
MKLSILVTAGLGVCLFLLLPFPAQAFDYSYARVVRLSFVQGDVQITRSDEKGWEQAFANMPIEQGFTIGTNNGRAEVEFESGASAYIAENTVLQFTELALSNGGRITKMTLMQGTATFYAHLASDDSFAILTPNVQVTIPRRAEVRLDVFKDGTSVSALQGEANVDSSAGTKTIEKGQTLGFNAATPDQVRTQRNPSPDDWDRWVNNRASSINTGTAQSLQYTNAPFQYGMSDLSQYGAWNYYPGYGFGWQPWNMWIGWAPFNFGRWCFYPGLGWTWVSYEPWGWVPYHFGNWVFSPAFGWVWLPGAYNYWCPAPVQWVRVGNRIGWTPLQPVKPSAAPPASAAPSVPVVVSGSKQLGGAKKNRVLVADMSSLSANTKMEILTVPPAMNGRLPKLPAGQGFHSEKPVSAASGTALAALQGGPAVVPTTPSAVRAGSTIVYDPVERRYVNSNSAPAAPATPSTMRITEGTTNGVPVASSSVTPMPNHLPNSLPPGAPAHVFAPPPARSVPPPPPRMVASPTLHTSAPSHSISAPASPAPHVSAPAPHSSGGHPH